MNQYCLPLGFAEMHELDKNFAKIEGGTMGRFVRFTQLGNKVTCADSAFDDVIGVTTDNCAVVSDDQGYHISKVIRNEFGSAKLKNIPIARGVEVYNEQDQMRIIRTYEDKDVHFTEHYDTYDTTKEHVARSNRHDEWVPVTIIGKVIVRDNGLCEPGLNCSCSKDGIAVPVTLGAKHTWRVLQRISKNTIMIFFK